MTIAARAADFSASMFATAADHTTERGNSRSRRPDSGGGTMVMLKRVRYFVEPLYQGVTITLIASRSFIAR
jgi:hypothetical protein